MHTQLKVIVTILSTVLILVLSACGSSPRVDDAAPVPEEISAQPTPIAEAVPASDESLAENQTGTTPVTETEVAAETDASTQTEVPVETQPEQTGGQDVFTFKLSGGIIGFCDTLTVSDTGEYALETCGREQLTGTLDAEDLELLQTWANELTDFSLTTEDNPGGADNLVSELVFIGQGSEAGDEVQRQVIFDWVNGLLIRLRPQPVAAPPTPEPPEIGPDGLCPEVKRPAMLVADLENPSRLMLIDPDGQQCEILLSHLPFGRIVTAMGSIYYPAFDPDAETVTIWQLNPDGAQTPLDFTTAALEQFGPFNFTVSSDGSKIAWAQTEVDPEVDPPLYRNSLWTANTDGSNLVTLLDKAENSEQRYLQPVRISLDNNALFYALQPDGLGGTIFSFSGRYDNLYRQPVGGGQTQLLFACPSGTENVPTCIGDISADGTFLAYSQPGEAGVQVIGVDGSPVSKLTPPATDFVGPAVFGPTGNLAFVSATLTEVSGEEGEVPVPNPGYLSFVPAPYTAEPTTLLADNSVATLWEWLDENRLAYGSLDEAGNIGTSIITVDGQQIDLSSNFPLAVLR
jgi:hypothetical protein